MPYAIGWQLVEQLKALIVKAEQLLGGVDTGVENIKNELESMKSALRDADNIEDTEGMTTWVRQLREIAYDIEDIIDQYIHYFGQNHGHGCIGFLRQIAHNLKHLGTRYRIATAVQNIKTRVLSLSSRRGPYTSDRINEAAGSITKRDGLHNRHVAALFMEEAELVGINEPREELIGWLVTGKEQLEVISVVGMGGLGKTTLVRKVYDDERVKGWFSCHAWITVTQSFKIEDILRSIINQFYGVLHEPLPEGINTMKGIDLIGHLRHFLRDKRYVVVLDDMWRLDAWEDLKYAFPSSGCGSRILVTTRIRDVAISCTENSDYLYDLQPLLPTTALSLFSMKAFRSFPNGVCSPELGEISERIVKICDGLPLAIVTIAGLLSKKGSFTEWKRLYDNLHSELANNSKLEPIKRILLLSYSDLPHSLKYCFLYFSIFPKDYAVNRITLIRLWIAEGFIEEGQGNTMEEVAVSYLNDLMDRNMVQVAEHYDYGRVRSCRVHDLIHELIVFKSKKENFSTTPFPQNPQIDQKIRRLSICDASDDALKNMNLSSLRAFFLFEKNALPFSSMLNLLYSFRFLRVLNLEGAPIGNIPIEFGGLVLLRYMSLRNTKITKLSESLGNLIDLETLDLKGTYVFELPKNFLNLQKLRHLLAYHYYTGRHPPFYYTHGVIVPRGIGRLKELQKLTYLEANEDNDIVKELGNLRQLKRLGIVKLRTEDGPTLCSSIEKLNCLLSFSVTSIGMNEFLDLNALTSPPPLLERLYLRGPLQTLPHWISSLGNLVRMRLRWSGLKEDFLRALQDLPNLVELALISAYDGDKLCCERGGFQKLQILDLELLANLKLVMVDGAMPKLRKMYIRGCGQLKQVPLGMHQLKELHLFDMSDAFIQRLRDGGEDNSIVKHIPIIRSYANQDLIYEEL